MTALSLLQSLGSIGLFASRTFAPAFVTAALVRFGPQLPLIRSFGLLADQATAPVWFTSDACLVVLALLTLAEFVGDKVPEVRDATDHIQPYLKPAVAAATSLGVLAATDAAFAQALVHQAGLGSAVAPLLAAAGTAGAVQLRQSAVGWLDSMDPSDTLHLRRLLSWTEDAWAVAGAVLLFVLPALMVVVLVGLAAVLTVVRKRLASREEDRRVLCSQCGQALYRSAAACPACHTANPQPCALGLLGQTLSKPAPSLELHAAALLGHLRCPRCAGRLQRGQPAQTCASCGLQPMVPAELGRAFVTAIDLRAAKTLAVVAGLSMVPILGFLAAALYGELQLVAPLRVHLPLTQRWLLKWPLRLLRWLVLAVQVVPLLNGLAALVDLLARYRAHRAALLRQLKA